MSRAFEQELQKAKPGSEDPGGLSWWFARIKLFYGAVHYPRILKLLSARPQ